VATAADNPAVSPELSASARSNATLKLNARILNKTALQLAGIGDYGTPQISYKL
jgi:hypothetical protein